MPNSVTAKIKSARKADARRPAFAVCVAGAFLAVCLLAWPRASAVTMQAGGRQYHLDIASTPAAQAQGLGGRASMPANAGMVFVFARPAAECFWMKDMHFSLDIVWLDSQKRVLYLKQNLSPQTYPASFCPPAPAKYVVELRAGQTHQAGIRPGQTVRFDPAL